MYTFRSQRSRHEPRNEWCVPMTPREQLAETLKQARLDAGYRSQAALARELHLSRPVITRAESASQPVPSDDVLVDWSRATGVPLDKLRELVKRTKSGTPEWFMPYRQAESEATMLRFWGPLVVPGLLQTEAYARALLSDEGFVGERLEELAITRLERQKVIGRTRIWALIDHTVLSRCLGSPEVMAEQCGHLVTLAEAQLVRVHVVPEGPNAGLGGAFGIASKDGVSTVSLTTIIRDITSTAADVVDDTMTAFEVILGASMSVAASLDFLRTQEDQWKARI